MAELHVANVTGLSTTITGRELTVVPVNRGHWAQRTLADYRPLLEARGSLGSAGPAQVADEPDLGRVPTTISWRPCSVP